MTLGSGAIITAAVVGSDSILRSGRDARHADRVALEEGSRRLTYAELDRDVAAVAATLLTGRGDLAEARVAFLLPPSIDYARVQRGVWRAGGVAVPLCTSHPPPELDYVLADAAPELAVASPDCADRLRPLAAARGIAFRLTTELAGAAGVPGPPRVAQDRRRSGGAMPATLGPERRAMIVYTSGTTGGPKGVVTTHGGLRAQIASLHRAWAWTPEDRILLTLPLHHVHGIVNVLGCALAAGAACVVHASFDAARVWDSFARDRLTLFMAVPTQYYRLIQAWDEADPAQREVWSNAARGLRLMVSGSAALPARVLERWREITGHVLLERYGMTETGMILSNPLGGERFAGTVGSPLPGVEVRLVDEHGVAVEGDGEGEVWVRGPAVFREYWGRPEATAGAFAGDWFRTGDVARRAGGIYRLLGRSSVDILKTGGYKVSALEIEEALRAHPEVSDCAVVGLADEEWGERVAAAVVPAPGSAPSAQELRGFVKERLAAYKAPREVLLVEALPRNVLGKVEKPRVKELFARLPAADTRGD
jgi:malonyl-CoA/methylmalonyl-CoA synthetase